MPERNDINRSQAAHGMKAAELKEASTRQLEVYYERAQGNSPLLHFIAFELSQRPSEKAQALLYEVQLELFQLEQGQSDEFIDWDKVITAEVAKEKSRQDQESKSLVKKPLNRASAALEAWMVTETLTPQVFNRPEDFAPRGTLIPLSENVPWGHNALALSFPPPSEGLVAYYQVYLGDLDVGFAQKELVDLYGPTPEIRTAEGQVALAVATFNQQGVLVGEFGVGVACFGWSFGRARAGRIDHLPFWHSAERLLVRRLRKRLSPVGEDQRPRTVSYEDLQSSAEWLAENLDLPQDILNPVRFAVRLVVSAKRSPPSSPLLNSFLLQDLRQAKDNLDKNTLSEVLAQYLRMGETHEVLRDPKLEATARQHLQHLPFVSWPNAGLHQLDALQQAAVNIALSSQAPLFSVLGPPGTGKTTLLRDIIAGVIGQRAEVLASFETPSDGFQEKVVTKIGDQRYDVYPLNDRLLGHEIVVCAKNNKAVENISLELPMRREINHRSAGLDFFAQTMDAYLAEKNSLKEQSENRRRDAAQPDFFQKTENLDQCWGIIAAALGNGRNRRAYVRSVWLDPGVGLKQLLENIIKSWNATEECESFIFDVENEGFSIPESEEQAEGLWQSARSNYFAAKQAVVNVMQSFGPAVIDKDLNYELPINEALAAARDHLFVVALELQRTFIMTAAPWLKDNLEAYTRIVLGARGSKPELLPHLWASGSLITPVISTTFASFQRMFAQMKPKSLGWVLIDEAGQASPQDAVGALNRAKNAVVVGDPKQIEPVVNGPQGLIAGIARLYGLEALDWMAPDVSVQTLADNANPFGVSNSTTTVNDRERTQLEKSGWPLLVHRRCAEPMFSIINRLAYKQQMIQGQLQNRGDQEKNAELQSCWIDVRGESKEKWCEQEGLQALDLVRQLFYQHKRSVFVISPFRSVARGLKHTFRQHKKNLQAAGMDQVSSWVRDNIGTIHTFQGRQAQRVIIVLGAQGEDEAAARAWVTDKVNIMNVAVSRAQRSIFILGNQHLWQSLGAMKVVTELLEREFP